jgi:hypothetical protein
MLEVSLAFGYTALTHKRGIDMLDTVLAFVVILIAELVILWAISYFVPKFKHSSNEEVLVTIQNHYIAAITIGSVLFIVIALTFLV